MPRASSPRPQAFAHSAPAFVALTLALAGCAEAKGDPAPATAPESAPAPVAAPASAPVTASASASASAAASAPVTASASAPVTAPASDKPLGARIWSKARFAWIHPEPAATGAWIGYLALGSSAPLRGGSVEKARVMGGSGCSAWYAVEPRGYVCAGATATVDPNDPAAAILRRDAADISSPWPYQYAESTSAPRYAHIPTRAEQREAEWDLEKHEAHIAKVRGLTDPKEIAAIDKTLVGVDLSASGQEPPALLPFSPLVREQRKFVALGSTVAYVRSFDVEGRTYLLTADQAIVPKDRVKPYPRSNFQGIALEGNVKLPLAFFRKNPRPKWKLNADGKLELTEETFPRLAWVGLTGKNIKQDGTTFVETNEPSVYVRADDAQIAEAVTAAPWLGQDDARDTKKWLDISVLNGTLVAYVGLRPVYATLISPGRGGLPYEGIDPVKTASTPTGIFRVDGKFRTATMVSSTDENLVHAEVNWVMNFHGPHALHGAYWHDGWGEPKSGGCVNLSALDAKWVFDWTDPPIPEGWHGLRAVSVFGPSTIVRVHR